MHIPVLLNEVIEHLNPQTNENFVDCTFGFGGHTTAILFKTSPHGRVLGIEIDAEVYKEAQQRIAEFPISNDQFPNNRLVIVNESYVNLAEIVEQEKFFPVNGILLDLGMSSWDLEESGRGFSFLRDEPLDMRYNKNFQLPISNFQTAKEIVNEWSEAELARIFRDYGQERFAKNIAKKIVEVRQKQVIETTFQLVEIIKKSFPRSYKFGKLHVATRTFQALRLAVNNELENLKAVLPQAIKALAKDGRLAIISFQSLEDSIVKKFFKENAKNGVLQILTKKPIIPQAKEIKENPKARTAKLRVAKII